MRWEGSKDMIFKNTLKEPLHFEQVECILNAPKLLNTKNINFFKKPKFIFEIE